jgi:tRNA-Thr(GGU) m(6)t(6)A37 methyltransferase TsaA
MMASEPPEIVLKSIGTIHSEIKERVKGHTAQARATIEIDPALTAALDNLDEFSHVIIIYYMHRSRPPAPLKVYPRHHAHPNQVGVFASRSPDRPNPIGKSTVRLLKREGNILTVAGLDAIDGTPVLDIKPYIPGLDSADNVVAPSWTKH